MTIDDIKRSYPVADVFKRYGLSVSKSGFVHCPFHKDSHASLKIYEGSNSWYCFSCNRGGDIFSFVMEMEHVDFPSAVQIISGEKNITYSPRESISPEALDDFNFKKLLRERNYWQSIKDKMKPIYSDTIINYSDLYATACKKLPIIEAEMDEFLSRPKN